MLTVAFFYGGVSPEHEVSVISTLQAAHALDRSRYAPLMVYVAKDGTWYTGEVLLEMERYTDLDALRAAATPVAPVPGETGRLLLAERATPRLFGPAPRRFQADVAFLGFHGGEGENGGFQGLMETLNVPYTGSGVFGSALGMDKVLSKIVSRDQGIPIVDWVAFRESDWGGHEEAWLDRCEGELGYPCVVKPSRLGSSIGISKADNRAELDAAIEEALRYDEKVVVERAVHPLREVNCSVLGDPNHAEASLIEEPVRTAGEKLLTFQEKYMRGGGAGKGKAPQARGAKSKNRAEGMASLDRLIPAPLGEAQTAEIRKLAVQIFQLFECAGVARIDFMIDDAASKVYFNEINTIPGSFSFYLWEPTGVPFAELVHRMIEIGRARHRAKNGRVRQYGVNLLSARSLSGLKGSKTQA